MIFADLISVVPGLMVWTVIAFGITFFVLRKFAFSRIQGIIDERRDRIREALDEADKARQEARELRELTKAEREEAKAERERILDESRRQAQAQLAQADEDLKRRLEENRKEIEAENRRMAEQIRRDVVELTLLAAEKVTGKSLDADDQRRLIDETIEEVDVKKLVSEN
jgi:F-type H+-transporting ATPase subunit b